VSDAALLAPADLFLSLLTFIHVFHSLQSGYVQQHFVLYSPESKVFASSPPILRFSHNLYIISNSQYRGLSLASVPDLVCWCMICGWLCADAAEDSKSHCLPWSLAGVRESACSSWRVASSQASPSLCSLVIVSVACSRCRGLTILTVVNLC